MSFFQTSPGKFVRGGGEGFKNCCAAFCVCVASHEAVPSGSGLSILWRWICANISAITRREANRGAMMCPAMPKAAFIQVMNRGVGAESQGSCVTLIFVPSKKGGRCSNERARHLDCFVRTHVHACCDRHRRAPWGLTC